MSVLVDGALRLLELGYALVPKCARTKRPASRGWTDQRLSLDELRRHLGRRDVDGICAVGGKLSGNRVFLDFDGEGYEAAYEELVGEIRVLGRGPCVKTGSGKRHVHVRVPDLPEDFTNKRFSRHDLKAIVEFRASKSLCVVPPSPGYTWIRDPYKHKCHDLDFGELYDVLSKWAGMPEWKQQPPRRYADTRGQTFVLRSTAEPPWEKFHALARDTAFFTLSWKHRNPRVFDRSLSGWDMSLASIAAFAGWSDQEIVDLLIAHRREWNGDLKLRVDYYARTLERARESVNRALRL